jgi:Tol biopolymer transport system component
MSDKRILCVAVMVCVIRLGDIEPKACQLAGVENFTPNRLPPTVAEPERQIPEKFMVWSGGYWLLGPDGEEKECLHSIISGRAAFSPNERWVAYGEYTPASPEGKRQGWLVIQSRVNLKARNAVRLNWGTPTSRVQPLWSSDSKRILVCEQAGHEDQPGGSLYRIYDMDSASVTTVRLPGQWSPSDWSSDCKRVLTSLQTEKGNIGVAWVHIDGTGTPEFLTSDQEVAHGARLSPDNRRILCQIGSPPRQNEASRVRLYVIDLITKKRTVIDKLGHTDSYCWSSDGSKVAYTWQMPLRQPEEVAERKAYLITCDLDGGNRKTITMRKYGVPADSSIRRFVFAFFKVVAWWR